MELHDLIQDDEARAELFPVVKNSAFLAHAAVAPLPKAVTSAIIEQARRSSREGQFDQVVGDAEDDVRASAAHLLDVESTEIAFTTSTSAGLASVAEGLEWRPGDNVVIQEGDFPANIYPWMALRRQGVDVRRIPQQHSALGLAEIERHLDDRTRLVALSTAHYVSGRPLQSLPEIGHSLRAHGILLCLDGIQSIGAQQICARSADFLVADGHKWLLAPKGFGLLYVRREVMDQLRPTLVGWRSVPKPHDFHVQVRVQSQAQPELAETARRYEPGSINELGLVGLRAALGLLQEFGLQSIEERIRTLRQRLVAGLSEREALIVGSPESREWSGIVSFRQATEAAEDTARRLRNAGIVVSVRKHADGNQVVRAAPHFYNTEQEIDRLLRALH